MEILKGIGVSPGVAISPAVVLDAEDLLVPRRPIEIDAVAAEVARLDAAVDEAVRTLESLRDTFRETFHDGLDAAADASGGLADEGARRASTAHESDGRNIAGIFDFHVGMLRDPSLLEQVRREITSQHVTAEYAVSVVMRRLAAQFLNVPDRYFSERVKDIYDIEKRVLKSLIGAQHEGLARLNRDVCVIAHDLLPSQTAALDRKHVRGFATDVGGRTSHTAIVARAMGIPAVVGLSGITAAVSAGQTVIIDGTRGMVIVDPDAEQITEHRELERQQARFDAELRSLVDLPAETLDGTHISLQANIEFPHEVDDAIARGAQGIGLYRTEFLFFGEAEASSEPSEEDHYQAYVDSLTRLATRPLVIRTLDLGADKMTQANLANPERNPFLGDRSIRMCLHDIPMFKRQLRAILRASVLGDVRIMFPMISTLMELRQARMVLRDVQEELEDEGIEYRRDIPVGIMIEVPSAALMANHFAKEADFFSIGTNDLIQYTLAVDRTNEKVAGLFCPAHPAVLSLIRDVIRAGARNRIPVSVCGEMAGEPLYTLLLLGLGLGTFSMNGPDVPEVKKIIRSTTTEHARQVARKVMSFDSERQVMHYLREETRKILPEAF